MKRALLTAGLLIAVAAAGISALAATTSHSLAAHTAAKLSTRLYRDHKYPVSFRYPSNWKAPAHGKVVSTPSGPSYEVDLAIPGNAAQAKVTVTAHPVAIPSFANGLVVSDPGGGPDKFHYYHLRAGGHPAMRVYRWSGKVIDGIDTFVDVGRYGYAIRMITGVPPFLKSAVAGYNEMVKTLSLPFS